MAATLPRWRRWLRVFASARATHWFRGWSPISRHSMRYDGSRRRSVARHPRLDVLVNNAGGVLSDYRLTKDGFEWHFGVNYLAQVLLTQLLLDALKAAAPSRVVNVSSSAHKGQVLPLDDLNFMRGFKSMPAYGRSKFALNLFTFELARRLAGTQVTANALHPGVVCDKHIQSGTPPTTVDIADCEASHADAGEGSPDFNLSGLITRRCGRDGGVLRQFPSRALRPEVERPRDGASVVGEDDAAIALNGAGARRQHPPTSIHEVVRYSESGRSRTIASTADGPL